MSIKFRTPYSNRPGRRIHCACPESKPDYILDETTNKLVECGTIPFYERIQSYHESTLLTYKLRKFNLGDSTALGSPHGIYGDFTNLPGSVQEVLQLQSNVKDSFNNLPNDVKAVFGYSFDQFYEATIDGTAERRIRDSLKSSNRGAGSPSGGPTGASEPGAGSPGVISN